MNKIEFSYSWVVKLIREKTHYEDIFESHNKLGIRYESVDI